MQSPLQHERSFRNQEMYVQEQSVLLNFYYLDASHDLTDSNLRKKHFKLLKYTNMPLPRVIKI